MHSIINDSILNKEQKKFFNKNGYLIINDFFNDIEVNTFTESLRKIIQYQIIKAKTINKDFPNIAIGEEFSAGMKELDNFDHLYISDISDYLLSLPETMQLVSKSELTLIAKELLNIDINAPLYLTNNGVIVSMPNDDEYSYSWHKEYFTTIPKSEFIQFWAPLVQDTNIDHGAIRICPGSHVSEWRGQRFIKRKRASKSYEITEEEILKYRKISIETNLKQILIMHPGLIHRSGFNKSDNTRFSLVGIIHKIENPSIRPLKPNYQFKDQTPEQYYHELFDNKKI